MSALPPKRTCGSALSMSTLCHQQTFGFPLPLLSIIHSDVPSELAIERINFLLDIVDSLLATNR